MDRQSRAGLILAVILGVGALSYVAGTGSHSDTSASPSSPPQDFGLASFRKKVGSGKGSQALCSRGAQMWTDGFNKSVVKTSQDLNIPNSSYFLVSTPHYVESLNSCFFELHTETAIPSPPPNEQTSDSYILYVTGGPSEDQVKDDMVVATEVASCSGATCRYDNPTQGFISGGYTYWTASAASAISPMSSFDFQNLVQRYMTSN